MGARLEEGFGPRVFALRAPRGTEPRLRSALDGRSEFLRGALKGSPSASVPASLEGEMTGGRWGLAVLGLCALVACGEAQTHGDTTPGGAAGSPSGGTSQAQAGSSPGGAGVQGGSSAGGGSAEGGPFHDLVLLPDADTTPVASCAGQRDLTLCQVVTVPDRSYDICVAGECVSPGCGTRSCNSPSAHFPIPPASDHHYLMALGGEEPVVADLVTGLQWQGCEAGLSTAACTGTRLELTWDEALQYCEDLSWGGKADWYLPDAFELLSIVDFGVPGPEPGSSDTALDPTLFPHAWSSAWTSHYADDAHVFYLQLLSAKEFQLAIVWTTRRDDTVTLRCARRGSSRDAGYVGERFVVSAPGPAAQKVIADPTTGLEWQGCLSGRSELDCSGGSLLELPDSDWFAYCADLTWGGSSDWRLPTYKELFSLAEFPGSGFASDAQISDAVFDTEQVNYLACASGDEPTSVPMLFDTYDADKTGPTSSYPVMCVRWK